MKRRQEDQQQIAAFLKWKMAALRAAFNIEHMNGNDQ